MTSIATCRARIDSLRSRISRTVENIRAETMHLELFYARWKGIPHPRFASPSDKELFNHPGIHNLIPKVCSAILEAQEFLERWEREHGKT